MLEDLVIDEFAISLVSSGLDSTAQQLLLSHSVTSFGKNLVPLANSGPRGADDAEDAVL